MRFNNIKAIIFDFDGVISESVNVKTEAFSKLYLKYGKEISEKVVEHHLMNGGISRFEKFQLYHKKYLGITLDEKEILDLSNEFSRLVVKNVIKAPYVNGAFEYIYANHEKYNLYISTGTPQDEMNDILKKKNINMYFQSVYGSPDIKTNHIIDIMINTGYENKELIFIGDADADIIAAKENNIPIIFREHLDGNSSISYSKMIKVKDLTKLDNYIF